MNQRVATHSAQNDRSAMKLTSIEKLARALNDAGVLYVVVGGLAVVAHGYGRRRSTSTLSFVLNPRRFMRLSRHSRRSDITRGAAPRHPTAHVQTQARPSDDGTRHDLDQLDATRAPTFRVSPARFALDSMSRAERSRARSPLHRARASARGALALNSSRVGCAEMRSLYSTLRAMRRFRTVKVVSTRLTVPLRVPGSTHTNNTPSNGHKRQTKDD